MDIKLKIAIAKLIFVNLIPVFGVIFLDWQVFEVVVSYILETLAIYIVFNIRYYFLEKKTNYPLPLAIMQLAMSLGPLLGILFGQVVIIYTILNGFRSRSGNIVERVYDKVIEMDLWIPLTALLIFEGVAEYMRKKTEKTTHVDSYIKLFLRMLYSNWYIFPATIIVAMFGNFVGAILFMIGFNLVAGYTYADERVVKYLKEKRRRFIERMSS